MTATIGREFEIGRGQTRLPVMGVEDVEFQPSTAPPATSAAAREKTAKRRPLSAQSCPA
jgi:hypothetical protein